MATRLSLRSSNVRPGAEAQDGRRFL